MVGLIHKHDIVMKPLNGLGLRLALGIAHGRDHERKCGPGFFFVHALERFILMGHEIEAKLQDS
jgi:hypothetical protein